MDIVRFLGAKDAKRVLSDHSTFALNSSDYYRQLENQDRSGTVGDAHENIVKISRTRTTYEFGAATLLSCWTRLDGERLADSDWSIFKDRADGIAIVSTVDRVREFLRELVNGVLDQWIFKDGHVKYYDNETQPPELDTMDIWFWKRKVYENQREYRFAFLNGSPLTRLQTLIFYVQEPKSYIEKIYLGPQLCERDKKRLLAGAIAANVADRIQDFDFHFKR